MKLKQIKKKKHLIRALKVYAELNCKPMSYYAIEKYDRPRLDEEGEWKTGEIVTLPVNHKRRVKKALQKYGIRAAMAYLTAFRKEKPQEVGIDETVIN